MLRPDALNAMMLPPNHGLLVAILITIAFTGVAWLVKGVDRSGAIAGAVMCFFIVSGEGPRAFIGLLAVFLMAWISTRIGYRRKQKLGTAESKAGRRASQVLANLSVAAGCAVLHLAYHVPASARDVFSLGMTAAFAEAAADTVSSELGQIQVSARMITTWKVVPSGTDGGLSLMGTSAGMIAALLLGGICLAARLVSTGGAAIAAAAAMVGMLADSFLGALFERRRLLNNDAVNFLGTLAAASLAIFTASFCK
jgi:uncharacterized protein (TIGR00297 family)